MCTDPKIFNGFETSCRECDQCAATYKNTWVSRCVAEKQTMPYAYAMTLTYANDKNGNPPLGARVYRYKDVSDMWKRIRSAGKRKWKENIDLRYVIVGEKGTRFGRCHYHGVVFSSHPIVELGELSHPKGNEFAYKRRMDWSIWGHGFVEFQVADRKGMAYCLKYILKSRMTAARSRGYGREGKTEWLASSYLWCSQVAIGSTWLWQKLQDMVEKGLCPSALRVRVPGGGDWYVHGNLQKDMCLFLHQANNEYRKERGRDLAGWSTLVNSVRGEIENLETGEILQRKTWGWLVNGEEQEQNTEITPEQSEVEFNKLKEWYAHKRRIAAPITNARATVRNCGHIVPCEKCRNGLSDAQKADLEQEYLLRREQWQEGNSKGYHETGSEYEQRFRDWWLTRLRPSRGCGLRETDILQEHFRRLVPVTKSQVGLKGKAAIGKTLQETTG